MAVHKSQSKPLPTQRTSRTGLSCASWIGPGLCVFVFHLGITARKKVCIRVVKGIHSLRRA